MGIQGTNTNKPTKADFEYERINTKHKIADNEIINESKAPTKPPVKVKLSAMATTAIPEPIQKNGESDEDLEEKSKSLEQMSGIVLNEIVDELLSEKKHNEIYDVSTRSKGFIQGTNANKQTKADFEHERTNTFHKATDNEIINETKAPTKPPGKVKISSMATTAIPEPIYNKGDSDEDLEELDQMAGIVLNKIFTELLSEKEYTKIDDAAKKDYLEQEKYTIKPTKADFEYERTNTMHKAVDNEIINQKEAPIEPPFNAKLTSKATTAKTPAPTHEKEDSDEDQEEMSIILEQMAELELNEIVPELLSKNEYNEIVDDNAAKNRDYVKQARKLHTENWTNIHNENDQDGKSHKASFKPMEKYTTKTIINASPKTVLQHTVTINNIEPLNKAVKAPEPGITVYETAANLSEENDNMSMIGQLAGTVINEIFTDILEDDSKVNKNNPSIQNEAVPKTKMGVSTVLYNGISNEINKKNTNDMQNGVLFTVKAKSSRANKIKVAEHPNKVEQNYKTSMKMENKDKMSVNESNKKNPNETRSSSDKKIGSIESINPTDTTDKKFKAVTTTAEVKNDTPISTSESTKEDLDAISMMTEQVAGLLVGEKASELLNDEQTKARLRALGNGIKSTVSSTEKTRDTSTKYSIHKTVTKQASIPDSVGHSTEMSRIVESSSMPSMIQTKNTHESNKSKNQLSYTSVQKEVKIGPSVEHNAMRHNNPTEATDLEDISKILKPFTGIVLTEIIPEFLDEQEAHQDYLDDDLGNEESNTGASTKNILNEAIPVKHTDSHENSSAQENYIEEIRAESDIHGMKKKHSVAEKSSVHGFKHASIVTIGNNDEITTKQTHQTESMSASREKHNQKTGDRKLKKNKEIPSKGSIQK